MHAILKRTDNELECRMIGEPFASKKNKVFKIDHDGKQCIAKVYSDEFRGRAENEYRMLVECEKRGIEAPKPVEMREGAIIMSIIEGKSAHETIDQSPEDTIDKVAEWLVKFHKAFDWKIARGDCILKNFLIGEKAYGIDFEESHECDPITDVGQACASLLASGEKFSSSRFELARLLCARYILHSEKDEREKLPHAIADGLRHYAPYRQDGNQMMVWASKIESKAFLCERFS